MKNSSLFSMTIPLSTNGQDANYILTEHAFFDSLKKKKKTNHTFKSFFLFSYYTIWTTFDKNFTF